MCCGKRYLVVLLIFIGYMVAIGSREMFTFVIIDVQSDGTARESLFASLNCSAPMTIDIHHQNWKQSYRFYTQTGYFIGNLLTQIPGGMLAVRFSATRVSGISILGSSALWFLMYFTLKYDWIAVMFIIRVVQGLLEGPVIPACNGVLVAWAPPSEKSTMVTISYAGAYLSPAVASVVTGYTLCVLGTMAPLFIYGGVGVIWSIIWLSCVPDRPSKCKCLSAEELACYATRNQTSHGVPVQFSEVPWKKILTSLPVSAIVVAAFCRNWIFAFLITQVPTYYHDVYNMDSLKQGIWSALPHVFMAIVVICVGFLVDSLIHRQILSTTTARKTAETLGFGIEASCLLALGLIKDEHLVIKKETLAIILLTVGVAMSGVAISGYQVNQLDLAPRYCAVITGIVRLGVVGSILSTVVAAQLTKHSPGKDIKQGWRNVFLVAGSLHFAGVLWYLIFASGERQPWAEPQEDLRGSINRGDVANVVEPTETDELVNEDFEDNENLEDSLFSRSMRIEHGELEESNWYDSFCG